MAYNIAAGTPGQLLTADGPSAHTVRRDLALGDDDVVIRPGPRERGWWQKWDLDGLDELLFESAANRGCWTFGRRSPGGALFFLTVEGEHVR